LQIADQVSDDESHQHNSGRGHEQLAPDRSAKKSSENAHRFVPAAPAFMEFWGRTRRCKVADTQSGA
jgi:hypothetical protein